MQISRSAKFTQVSVTVSFQYVLPTDLVQETWEYQTRDMARNLDDVHRNSRGRPEGTDTLS